MDSKQELQLAVEALDDELNLEASEEVNDIYPEDYETYLGDGIYLDLDLE